MHNVTFSKRINIKSKNLPLRKINLAKGTTYPERSGVHGLEQSAKLISIHFGQSLVYNVGHTFVYDVGHSFVYDVGHSLVNDVGHSLCGTILQLKGRAKGALF